MEKNVIYVMMVHTLMKMEFVHFQIFVHNHQMDIVENAYLDIIYQKITIVQILKIVIIVIKTQEYAYYVNNIII